MRPEDTAHRGKGAAGKAFKQTRMIPEFELDDVGLSRQARNLIETVGNDDAGAAGFDQIQRNGDRAALQAVQRSAQPRAARRCCMAA